MTWISPFGLVVLGLAVAISTSFRDSLRLSLSRPGRVFTRVHPWEKILHPAKVVGVAVWASLVLFTDLDRPLMTFLPLRASLALQWTGAFVALGGLAIACWAKIALGRQFAGRLALREDHELITSGPYRRVRHPIYTGAILALWGTVLALDSLVGLLIWGVLFTLVLCLHTVAEEALLVERFGEAYRRYRREVPRLIPIPRRAAR